MKRVRPKTQKSVENNNIFQILEELFQDCHDFEYGYRLATQEGPPHRARTLEIQIDLLGMLLSDLKDLTEEQIPTYDGEAYEIEMTQHHPPHHHHHHHALSHGYESYPIDFPIDLLKKYLGNDTKVDEAVEYLIEGPPHEVIGNIIIQHLLEAIFSMMQIMKNNGEEPDSIPPESNES